MSRVAGSACFTVSTALCRGADRIDSWCLCHSTHAPGGVEAKALAGPCRGPASSRGRKGAHRSSVLHRLHDAARPCMVRIHKACTPGTHKFMQMSTATWGGPHEGPCQQLLTLALRSLAPRAHIGLLLHGVCIMGRHKRGMLGTMTGSRSAHCRGRCACSPPSNDLSGKFC
jgi:hypothetical protein